MRGRYAPCALTIARPRSEVAWRVPVGLHAGTLVTIGVTLCVLLWLLPQSVTRHVVSTASAFVLDAHAAVVSTHPPAASPTIAGNQTVSALLARLPQLDPGQYASMTEYQTWAESACSAASMTEVINAYRALAHQNPYRITTILHAEIQAGAITPSEGLLDGFVSIRATVARFGFTAIDLSGHSLDLLIARANHGAPIIVSFPPATWAGGHLLVIRGGDAQQVQLADSSQLNMQVMSRATFASYWRGFAVLVRPA